MAAIRLKGTEHDQRKHVFDALQSYSGLNKRLDQWFSDKRFILFLTLAISLTTVILYALFSSLGTLDGDDYSIGLMMSDRFPVPEASLFVLKPLSYAVLFLEENIAQWNWYYLLNRTFTFLGLWYSNYMLISCIRRKDVAFMATGILWILLVPHLLVESNFTYSATFLALSGEIGFLLWARCMIAGERISGFAPIFSMIFFLSGFIFRMHAWMLTLPFLFGSFAFLIFRKRARLSNPLDILRVLWPCVLGFALCIFMLCINSQQDTASYDQWEEYNSVRASIYDYPKPTFAAIEDALSELGISENDYYMIAYSRVFDQHVYPLEKLRAVYDIIEYQEGTLKGGNPVVAYAESVLASPLPLLPVILLCLTYILIFYRKDAWSPFCLSLFVGLLLCLYFSSLGRIPTRVEYSIWLAALVLILCCIPGSTRSFRFDPTSLKNALAGAGCICAMTLLLVPGLQNIDLEILKKTFSADSETSKSELYNYMCINNDSCLMMDGDIASSYRSLFDYRYLPPNDVNSRILYTFGWVLASPQLESVKETYGLETSMDAMLNNDNVLFLSNGDDDRVEPIITYLKEHYNETAEYEPMDTIYDSTLNKAFEIGRFVANR